MLSQDLENLAIMVKDMSAGGRGIDAHQARILHATLLARATEAYFLEIAGIRCNAARSVSTPDVWPANVIPFHSRPRQGANSGGLLA